MHPLDLSEADGSEVGRLVDDAVAVGRPVVVPTSGFSGPPKQVLLSMRALTASAGATLNALGGDGQWVAALNPERIGGLQVYVRSSLAGVAPVTVAADSSFGVASFAVAVAAMRDDMPHYVALVPTQVHRLLAETAGREALARFDRVLIGGAPLPEPVALALDETGIAWSHTYGMTETAGGCLYDGVPLPGVQVRVEAGAAVGRLLISGPMLAEGYHHDPVATSETFITEAGRRWFRTSDLGRYDHDRGRWQVLGRADDVITTGGHKVHPDDVVSALSALEGVMDAAVVGVPDPQWGERVVALLVPSAPGPPDAARAEPTTWARSRLGATLPRHALPTRVRWADAVPRLLSGKVDTAGVRAAFTQEGERI